MSQRGLLGQGCVSVLVVVVAALGARPALAADHYVRAGASGNGADWTNALPSLPPTLVRGDTYFVAAGSYGAYAFNTPGSATITIKRATASDHGTGAGWQAAYGTGVASFTGISIEASNLVFDGQTGGGPGSWKTGHGFEIYDSSAGSGGSALVSLAAGVGNVTLRHLHAHATLDTKTAGVKGTLGGNHHIAVSYCYFHTLFGVHFHMNGWTDSLIEYSYFAENKSTAEWHSEGISYIGTVADLTIRYNIWYDIEGTAIFAGVNNGLAKRWKIYGNLLSLADCPPIAVYHGGTNLNGMEDLAFHNNTITRISASQGGIYIEAGSGNQAKNNIWFTNRSNTLAIAGDHDYNWFGDNLRIDGCSPPCDLDPAALAAEAHAEHGTASPFVAWDGVTDPASADHHLKAPTMAGASLAAEFSKDMFGNTRGADGVWDRGAVEYGPLAPQPDASALQDGGASREAGSPGDGAGKQDGALSRDGKPVSDRAGEGGRAASDGCSCSVPVREGSPAGLLALFLLVGLALGLRARGP